MSEQRYFALAVAGVLLCSAAPRVVLAQRSGATALDEIVVTARKREENLQDVPVAVSVFGGDALQQAGVLSARDLYAVTPGLNYDTGFDQNAATPAIRGVVSNEIATYRQKVTTFLDGMPILGQQGTVPFTAIQQVEVLRGPQSAAFGRSTFGGAINYKSREPGDQFDANVDLDVGSESLLNAHALISGPLAERLGGLIAIGNDQRDGEGAWRTRLEGVGLGGEKSQNVLAKLLFEPTEKSSIEFRYRWLDVDNQQTPRVFFPLNDAHRVLHPDAVPQGQPCGGGIVPPPQPSCAYVGTVEALSDPVYDYNYAATGIDHVFVRNHRDRSEIDATFDVGVGLTLEALGFSSSEYYERATDSNLTNDAFGFERDPTNIDETYAELRLTSPGDRGFRYGVGVSYYDYSFLTNIYRSRANYDAGTANQRFSEAATNTGVFFNLTYDATKRTTLSLEGRYQNDDVSGNAPQSAGGLFELAQKTTTFLPRLSVTFAISDNATFYAQAAKGNNPAGVNVGAVDPAVVAASQAFPQIFDYSKIAFFEEETVQSYEVGIKGTIRDRTTYAVNVYKLDWKNFTQPFNLNFAPGDFVDLNNDGVGDAGTPYAGLDFSPGRSFLGAGDVTGQGMEFEGSFAATDQFRIRVAASYIDISYASGACSTLPMDFGVPPNAATAIGLPCVSVAGHELGTQPKFSGSVDFEYNKAVSNGLEWFARWSTRYNSSQYVSEMNLAKLDAYSISDFRIGLSRDKWRAELYATNLFDDDTPQGPLYFFDGRILTPAGTPAPPPFAENVNYTTRRGRTVGARFSYHFGGR